MDLPAAFAPVLLESGLLTGERPKPIPEDEEVVAGWGAFGIFLLMAVVVGLLGWSMVRQLRKVRANREAGVYGEADIPRRPEDEEISESVRSETERPDSERPGSGRPESGDD